jgi:hypothetical protein
MSVFDQLMQQIVLMEAGYDPAFIEALRHSDKGPEFKEDIDAIEKRMAESHSVLKFWDHKKLRDAINKDSKALAKKMGVKMEDLSKDPKQIQKELLKK